MTPRHHTTPICPLLLAAALAACASKSRTAKTVDTPSSTNAQDVVVASIDSVTIAPVDTTPRITVCVERRNPEVVYHYTVHNAPQSLLRVIEIGEGEGESDNPDGGGELSIEPLGEKIDWDDPERHLSSPGVITPPHWYAEAERAPGTPGFTISWFAEGTAYGIQPGQTLAGFSIAVPHEDSAYVRGHWRMLHDAGTPLGGRLQRELADSSCRFGRSHR